MTRAMAPAAGWLLALALMATVAGSAAAQEPAAAPAAPAAAPAAAEPAAPADPAEAAAGELAEAIDKSIGVTMLESGFFGLLFYVALGLISLVSVMIILERLVNLRRVNVIPPKFVSDLRALLGRGNVTERDLHALSVSSNSPVARVLHAAVLKAGRPLPEVEKAMEDAIAREVTKLRSRHRLLSVLSNVATLVGLHGTVVGMIFSFSTVAATELGQGEALAGSIGLALYTTAIGLTIAIPCVLAAAFFSNQVDKFMHELDECLIETLPSFSKLERAFVVTTQQADELMHSGAN